MISHSCIVEEGIPQQLRLDRYIAENLKLLTRSQIRARKLLARVNGKEVKISRILRSGDSLELQWAGTVIPDLIPEDIPLDVIYEDSRAVVVNKAQGMVVHPGAGNYCGTLANALLYRGLAKTDGSSGFRSPGPENSLRPGIVHRLDKDTSGLIIAAWDDGALEFLARQFRKRKAVKTYAALVQGTPKEQQGRIETRIARNPRNRKLFAVSGEKGKKSLTLYKTVSSWGRYSLLLLRPKTGRTHQLRVHLKALGHPILGDPLYGSADPLFPRATLMLHAKRLSVVLPGHQEQETFRTPLPWRFHKILLSCKQWKP
ncbi:MAG: RluA family pseudouridine synthase [Treponema sp.]|jgi:23S rRNA pseudouridine1911/1915/1917 synthase|nr:RluA family pseudouridine synthase [Treponema sp.]